MRDVAAINAVLQHQIKSSAGKLLTPDLGAVSKNPPLALDSRGLKLFLKGAYRLEFHIPPEDMNDSTGFLFIDDQLVVLSEGRPPIHMPFFLDAAILSRMRSPATSRSNWANESSTFRVSRPMEVVVLNCCVMETKETSLASNASTLSLLSFAAPQPGRASFRQRSQPLRRILALSRRSARTPTLTDRQADQR